MKVTPMMAQYMGIKEEAGEDVLLFYRMGDFYELFFQDAVKAAAALDIALGGLAVGEVIGLVGEDHVVLIGLPDLLELGRRLGRGGAFFADMLGAGDLRGFAETAIDPVRQELVIHVADGRAARQTGGRV